MKYRLYGQARSSPGNIPTLVRTSGRPVPLTSPASISFPQGVSFCILGGVASSIVSIFISSVLFGLAILFWLIDSYQKGSFQLCFPPFSVPVLLFSGWALLSIPFSDDPVDGLLYFRQLLRLIYLFLIVTYVSRLALKKAFPWIVALLTASATVGIYEYLGGKDVHLLNRIDGFMSHWMTFSGQMMLVVAVLPGFLLFLLMRDRFRFRGATLLYLLAAVVCATALVLTETRNAWLGALAAILLFLFLISWRWMLAGVISAVMLFALLPVEFQDRFYSGLDTTDTTTQVRIELLKTGGRLIAANPVFGVGPRQVPEAAFANRTDDRFPQWAYQHLHNNYVQIAAEMGMPALLFWLAIWAVIAWDLFKMRRRSHKDSFSHSLATMGLCALAAFLVAGMFEYNFGDSEVAILLSFLVVSPYTGENGFGNGT